MWLQLTPAYDFLLKEELKMIFMAFTVLSCDLFSAQTLLFTCTVMFLKKLFVFLCGTLDSNDLSPPPLVLHHCFSHCMSVYI